MPFYDLIIPYGYTETVSLEKSGFDELASYVSISAIENPDNAEQAFQTFTFDLVNIYAFDKFNFTTTQVQTVMSREGDTTTFETIINVNINLKYSEIVTNVTALDFLDNYQNEADPYFSNLKNNGVIE